MHNFKAPPASVLVAVAVVFLWAAVSLSTGNARRAAPPAAPVETGRRHTAAFVVFPQDCNANPPMLFGGRLLAEMDRCAGVTVRRLLYASAERDAVTVAANNLIFHKSAAVKDLVVVSGEVTALGDKSITVRVEAERETAAGRELLASGDFVFVAYDLAAKKSVPHGLCLPAK